MTVRGWELHGWMSIMGLEVMKSLIYPEKLDFMTYCRRPLGGSEASEGHLVIWNNKTSLSSFLLPAP